jgi:hypothetical protein
MASTFVCDAPKCNQQGKEQPTSQLADRDTYPDSDRRNVCKECVQASPKCATPACEVSDVFSDAWPTDARVAFGTSPTGNAKCPDCVVFEKHVHSYN